MKRDMKRKEIPFYLLAVAIAVFIYGALNQNMEIMLKPYVLAMQLLYQMQFEFVPNLGYREVYGLFTIGRDCIGGKLFVCLFSILNLCCLSHYKGVLSKMGMILSFCIASLFLSFVVTVIRIAASIPFCGMPDFKLIHTILSLLIYFGSGIMLYAIINYQFKGKGELELA